MIRLVLADDMPAVREIMRCGLQGAPDRYRIVGEAGDGLTALSIIAELAPDVIILDVDMPGMSGVDVVRVLRSRGDETPVILCSSWEGIGPDQLPPGVTLSLRKPFRLDHLTAVVERAAAALMHAD